MHLFSRSFGIMAVFFIFLLSGCSEADPVYRSRLILSENGVGFDKDGGQKSIVVKPFPESELWEAAYENDASDWFTFETAGDSLKVTAEANCSESFRSGAIVLSSPSSRFESYVVRVCQEAADSVVLSVSADNHIFDSEGGEYVFTVSSNYDWTAEADADWLAVKTEGELVIVSVAANATEAALEGSVSIVAGSGALAKSAVVSFTQDTRKNNPYFKLVGKWEITAAKWYYSPNGSLNSLNFNPNPIDYYLIFDLEEKEYGKTLQMRNFLRPDTSLEVRYDKESGNIIIPFGWTVYSYDTFFYITLVGSSSFSYASLEVDGVPSEDGTSIALELPSVDGFNHVGFGLWTYNDNGDKVAVGSQSYPTMFPMGPIVFKKQ